MHCLNFSHIVGFALSYQLQMLIERAARRLRLYLRHLQPENFLDSAHSSPFRALHSVHTSSMQSFEGSGARDAKRRRVEDSSLHKVYIVGVARTPLGAFQGSLSHLSAAELGAIAIKAAIQRSCLPSDAVEEVFLGNVCSANLGQAPARIASLKAGLPEGTDATSVNKVCSSGLKAVALGAQAIALGLRDVVVSGGMESMSNVPYYVPAARRGARLGHTQLIDGLLQDGLEDATYGIHMGECADACAAKHGISREEQDNHAIESVARARRAVEAGISAWEVVPIARKSKKPGSQSPSGTEMISEDEAISKMNPEKLRKLPPFFDAQNGTVTAGNASPITDGAAAVVLASAEAVRRHRLPVLGRILGFADAALNPRDFPEAPAYAIPRALQQAGLTTAEVNYWEINEAFSVVDLVNQKLLKLDAERVNVLGGAVAIGHPIGATGARLIVTLLNVLRMKGGRFGVAAVCNGGGGASAMVIERVEDVQ